MQESLHIYICSTYRDLVSERNAVVGGLEELRSQFQSFTYFCPKSIQPLTGCKEEISRSDVLILIVGHLQGVIAPGQDISYGEVEYNEGIEQGKKIWVYFRAEKSGIFPVHFERDQNRANQLKRFKNKLNINHSPKIFGNSASLTKLLTTDIFSLANEVGLAARIGSRNIRFKARPAATRKLPMTSRPIIAAQPNISLPEEHSTRTLPIFKKALATPFHQRKSGLGRTGKGMLLALLLVIVAGVALAEFHKLTLRKPVLAPLPSSLPPNTENLTPPVATPAPLAKPISTLLLMDDTDTSKSFLSKAMNGSPADQFLAGQMYEQGTEVPRNDSLAFRWYKKAADQGLAEAQYKTGLLFRIGKGTTRSSYQAAHWFQAAADQGFSKAQVKLGQMYRYGKGVARNETTAFKWFLKAADQKDPEAEKILAELKEN